MGSGRFWERLEGLPVHRHNHSKRSTVYGRASEIHAWIAKRENHNECENTIRSARRPTRFASLTSEQLVATCIVARTQAVCARRRIALINAQNGKVQTFSSDRNQNTGVLNNLSVAV